MGIRILDLSGIQMVGTNPIWEWLGSIIASYNWTKLDNEVQFFGLRLKKIDKKFGYYKFVLRFNSDLDHNGQVGT